MVGGGLFQSPPVTKKSPTPTEKSPTPTEKSPTLISKRCWTLEYSGGLELSSPFMEQWTLDARGVLWVKKVVAVTPSTKSSVTFFNFCLIFDNREIRKHVFPSRTE